MRRKSMSGPVKCLVYIIALGVVSFVTGRLLPKRWFKSDRFPFRCNEKEKKLYKALRVKDWQNKVPDMSRVFTKLMPAKKLNADTLADIPRMLEETCVAEFIHVVLSVLGLACLWLWPGFGGAVVTLVYILLGNVPFIIIQRYNRPRLQRLLARRGRGGKG